MTVDDAIKQCYEDAHNTRSPNTARAYLNGMKIFAEFLGSEKITTTSPLSAIEFEYFIRFPSWIASLGYAKKTTHTYLSGVKYFLDWLVIGGSLHPTYSDTLRFKMAYSNINRKREFRLPRTPKRGDVDKMLEAVYQLPYDSPIKERNIALVHFLHSSGCRNNEAVQLKIKDIDLGNRSALVIGKGNKERRVYFDQKTATALETYWTSRKFREKSHPAFARHDNSNGKGANYHINKLTTKTIRLIVDEVAIMAGIDRGAFTPHHFRHAFAIEILAKTHDIALTQDLMGHASPASTRVYAKIYPEDLQKAHRMIYG